MNQRKEDVKPEYLSFEDTADRHGRSIRQLAFEAFDQGERPQAFTQRMGCKPGTIYTYHDQWKKERGILQGKAGPAGEECWDPFGAIATTLEEIAVQTGIPFELLAQNFLRSLDQTGKTAQALALHQWQRKRHEAARSLNRIISLITIAWALGMTPEKTLSVLKRQGIDFTRFRAQAK